MDIYKAYAILMTCLTLGAIAFDASPITNSNLLISIIACCLIVITFRAWYDVYKQRKR